MMIKARTRTAGEGDAMRESQESGGAGDERGVRWGGMKRGMGIRRTRVGDPSIRIDGKGGGSQGDTERKESYI